MAEILSAAEVKRRFSEARCGKLALAIVPCERRSPPVAAWLAHHSRARLVCRACVIMLASAVARVALRASNQVTLGR